MISDDYLANKQQTDKSHPFHLTVRYFHIVNDKCRQVPTKKATRFYEI